MSEPPTSPLAPGPKRAGRGLLLLLWFPLALYLAIASVCIVSAKSGANPFLTRLDLDPLGSFIVFFYISYLVLWKLRRSRLKRLILSAILPFAPLVPLALLDVAGIEGPTIPGAHGLTLPNTVLWLWPGAIISYPTGMLIARLKPPDPAASGHTYVRGGIPQPDGSLILYGAAATGGGDYESETFQLLARLDAAGNLDPGFAPVAVPLTFVKDAFTQPDGTVLVSHASHPYQWPVIDRMSPSGTVEEIVRVLDYDDNDRPKLQFTPPKHTSGILFLPGWLSNDPDLIRLLPDGHPDEPFNAAAKAAAAKAIATHDLGSYRFAVSHPQGPIPEGRIPAGRVPAGRIIVAFNYGLLCLDARGQLLPPGVVDIQRTRIGEKEFRGINGLALHPNGSVFVAGGDESHDDYLPRLQQFDRDLREVGSFSRSATSLAMGSGRFHVLGFRADGGAIVSLVQRGQNSRILFLGPQGQLIRELRMPAPPPAP